MVMETASAVGSLLGAPEKLTNLPEILNALLDTAQKKQSELDNKGREIAEKQTDDSNLTDKLTSAMASYVCDQSLKKDGAIFSEEDIEGFVTDFLTKNPSFWPRKDIYKQPSGSGFREWKPFCATTTRPNGSRFCELDSKTREISMKSYLCWKNC